jgi:hypothetical protein
VSDLQSGTIGFPCDISPGFVVKGVVVFFEIFVYREVLEGAMMGVVSGLVSMTVLTLIQWAVREKVPNT